MREVVGLEADVFAAPGSSALQVRDGETPTVTGSGFPHAECVAMPADDHEGLEELDEQVQDDITFNNAQQLVAR